MQTKMYGNSTVDSPQEQFLKYILNMLSPKQIDCKFFLEKNIALTID